MASHVNMCGGYLSITRRGSMEFKLRDDALSDPNKKQAVGRLYMCRGSQAAPLL